MKPIVLRCSRETEPERWHEIRRTGLGGSDIAAVAGLSPWRGPLAVYLEKVGQTSSRESTESMQWGTELEDTIAKKFARDRGFRVRKSNVILRHPKYAFMIANLDRWVEEPDGSKGVLEVKNVGEYKADEWAEDHAPDYYAVQLHWYLAITGAPYGWLAPLIGGDKLRPVRMLRDERMIESLIQIGADFWQRVEQRIPPAIDASKAATEVLRYCYPQSEAGKVAAMGPNQEAVYKDLMKCREGLKILGEEERLYQNTLIEWMKDAEQACLPDGRTAITYKGYLTRRLDTKSLAAAHPEIVAPYYVESTSRRFLVGKEEGNG